MKSKSPTPVIKALTDVLTFGKYKGHTIEWLLEHHPGYIIWLVDEHVAKVSDEIYQTAQQYDYESHDDWGGIDMYDWMDEPF